MLPSTFPCRIINAVHGFPKKFKRNPMGRILETCNIKNQSHISFSIIATYRWKVTRPSLQKIGLLESWSTLQALNSYVAEVTCLNTPLWYVEIIWQFSEVEHFITNLRKSSMVVWLVRKASTLAPEQWAKQTTFPNEMPFSLTTSSGSQQSSIDSSNHLQGPIGKKFQKKKTI